MKGLAAEGIIISAANIGSALKRKTKGKAKLNKAPKPVKTASAVSTTAAAPKTKDFGNVAAIFKLVRAVGVDDAESILNALSK